MRWLPDSQGSYSSRSSWRHFSHVKPEVKWYKLVWFSQNIPRMAFISWLAIRERLATKDRISKYKPNIDLTCVLCKAGLESHNHLFFECSYSVGIWSSLMGKCGECTLRFPWPIFIEWAATNWKGKFLPVAVKKLCLIGAVYAIWRERNNRIFKNESKSPMVILKDIINIVRKRLLSMDLKPSPSNANVLIEWCVVNSN